MEAAHDVPGSLDLALPAVDLTKLPLARREMPAEHDLELIGALQLDGMLDREIGVLPAVGG